MDEIKREAIKSQAKMWCTVHGVSEKLLKEQEDGSVTLTITFD